MNLKQIKNLSLFIVNDEDNTKVFNLLSFEYEGNKTTGIEIESENIAEKLSEKEKLRLIKILAKINSEYIILKDLKLYLLNDNLGIEIEQKLTSLIF
jgi:nitrogenase molybdenum-iron protein alpha/beta subunit